MLKAWKGQPPKITRRQYAVLRAAKRARDAIPSNRELAAKFGVSTQYVERVMNEGIQRYEVDNGNEG